MQTLTSPLTGLCNAVVYGYNKKVVAEYRRLCGKPATPAGYVAADDSEHAPA